jgi:hypothetical protein
MPAKSESLKSFVNRYLSGEPRKVPKHSQRATADYSEYRAKKAKRK